ncbi:MAG: DUF4388 domain-containing protein [Candidatus Aminicenantes bacterium]|nr:DUF4388 domain-containing protein [Candidatus Aminicenantes bacterium]
MDLGFNRHVDTSARADYIESMEDIPSQGSLSDHPLPRLLHLLWRQKKTGRLSVTGPREEVRLSLMRGLLALDREALDEKRFLKHLGDRGLLTPARKRRLRSLASGKTRPLLQRLAQKGVLDSALLWRELEAHFQNRLVGMFEWPDGRFDFSSSSTLDLDLLLAGMPTSDLILSGIRRMARLEAVDKWLARDQLLWQAFSPAHPGPAVLEPHERYILHQLSEGRTVADILSLSHLSRPETSKALFALACTGLAGPSVSRPHSRTPSDFSFSNYEKILSHFKNKAGIIYRYVSKEVGPVAMSIMRQALEEVNAWLGPGLPKVTLDSDGCPDVKALLRGHAGLFREDDSKNLFRILDEILAAEVLMVKRTLGGEHESALVRALER